MVIYSLLLPRSRMTAQWRDDNSFRIGRVPDVEEAVFAAVELFSTEPANFGYELKQQVWPGDSPNPTWWLLISALSEPAAVSAVLADGSPVPVHQLGPVLLCEWESTPQRITFTANEFTHVVEPFRSPSRGPAPFPYRPAASVAIEGWVDYGRLDESQPGSS
jgi:hypothetical protein